MLSPVGTTGQYFLPPLCQAPGKKEKHTKIIKKNKNKQLFKGGNNGFERRQLNLSDERMRSLIHYFTTSEDKFAHVFLRQLFQVEDLDFINAIIKMIIFFQLK